MKKAIKLASVLLALTALLGCLAACSRGGEGPAPEGTCAPEGLTQAQQERIMRLAKAFNEFGPFDIEEGLDFGTCEYMIYCFFMNALPESELSGFGKVTVEEADKALDGVFKGMKLPELMRTKFDAAQEQDYFVLNGCYYIRMMGEPAEEFSFIDAKPYTEEGSPATLRAKVEVRSEGRVERVIVLDLMPDEEWVYSAVKCDFQFAD